MLPFEETDFVGNNEKVRFYTGLSCYDVLMKTFNHVAPGVSCRSLTLSKFQEFVMVLMKLRLNMPFQDLAYRFRLHVSSVSRIFTTWMVIMIITNKLWGKNRGCFEEPKLHRLPNEVCKAHSRFNFYEVLWHA